jgi:hypothetical protein
MDKEQIEEKFEQKKLNKMIEGIITEFEVRKHFEEAIGAATTEYELTLLLNAIMVWASEKLDTRTQDLIHLMEVIEKRL